MRLAHSLLLVLLLAAPAHATKRLGSYGFSYAPTFGIGSTSSVAFVTGSVSSFGMIAPDGGDTSVVRVFTTAAAYIAANPPSSAAGATPYDMLIPANTATELEIPSGYKISAFPAGGSGTLYSTIRTVTPGK